MSRYRRLKIEGGALFCTLALADRGGNATELSGRFGERTRGHDAARLCQAPEHKSTKEVA
jgi:hypothetical protein